ncbi:MAG: hypothetical protein V4681_03955 [Patescibacteria group bacterium]
MGTDGIITENPNLAEDWKLRHHSFVAVAAPVAIPDGVTSFVEDVNMLLAVKAAKDLACVDIVIVTRLADGTPAVLLSKRKGTEAFGGLWWIYGGSISAYGSLIEFIARRAEKECGVPVHPEALIGVYRTSAADLIQSTTQPCYAAHVPVEVIDAKMGMNAEHDSVGLFTADDLNRIPEHEQHWYPFRVAHLALAAMP